MRPVTLLPHLTCALLIVLCGSAHAQGPPPDSPSTVEVGIQFSSVVFSQRQFPTGALAAERPRTEAGFGGRITLNLNRHIAFEAEGNFFPHENVTVVSGGRLLQGQFGLKAGERFRKFGVFGKVRPGFASFGKELSQVGTSTVEFNGQEFTFPIVGASRKTHFSLDLGGVLEFYPSPRVLTRIDVGDTILHYGDNSFAPGSGVAFSLGTRTTHNLQVSAGIGFRLGSRPQASDQKPQNDGSRRFEAGVQFSSFTFSQVERFSSFQLAPTSEFRDWRAQLGFGGRLTFNVTPSFALEAQGDFFPRDAVQFNGGRAGGRALQGVAGAKLGKRFERFGVFAKARPGVVSFSKTISFDGFDNSLGFPFRSFRLERRTHFAFDLGGVLEFYPSARIVTRFDGGDTMIRYGRSTAPSGLGFSENAAETLHNFEFSAGVGLRF